MEEPGLKGRIKEDTLAVMRRKQGVLGFFAVIVVLFSWVSVFAETANSLWDKELGETGINDAAGVGTKGFTVNPSKYDYFFGRVGGENATRSLQNLKDLNSLGITNENQLMNIFNKAFKKGTLVGIIEKPYGTTLVKSVNVGNIGKIDVSFFYSANNMIGEPIVSSIIPKRF